jgi:dTDP-4-amino-4,6-dideoxygalactose transaminase
MKNHGQISRNISNEFGFVSRLDSIQAAILSIKLNDLDSTIDSRRLFAEQYQESLGNSKIQNPICSSEVFHSYHLYVIEIDNRDKIQDTLKSFGIETKIHYPTLITEQIAYTSRYPEKKWNIPVAKKQKERILSLPIHQNLNSSQIDYVAEKLKVLV